MGILTEKTYLRLKKNILNIIYIQHKTFIVWVASLLNQMPKDNSADVGKEKDCSLLVELQNVIINMEIFVKVT